MYKSLSTLCNEPEIKRNEAGDWSTMDASPDNTDKVTASHAIDWLKSKMDSEPTAAQKFINLADGQTDVLANIVEQYKVES